MENGAGGGGVNGFGVPDKETASGGGGAGNGNAVVGSFGLGENNIMMGRHVHHHHHHDGFDGGGSGGGGAGPTSGANENSIYMYGDDVATAPPHTNSSVPPFTVGGGAAAAAVAVRLSQAFNCSNTAPLRSFKSPGMATSLGFPFTCAQWKELERQAMVYKYMMASLPVPPDLLLPLPTDAYNAAPPSFHTQTGGSSVLGFSGKNRDLEPGRCKRTDGKKWRCSKEVAPNQKYCERHLHRGRPRSRKPVEDHTNTKKTRLQQPTPLESPSMVVSQPANPAPSSSQLLASSSSSDNKHNEGPQCLDSRMDHSFSISPFNESHRSLDWEMAAMGGGGTEEQLQQLMAFESNVYRDNAQILQQQMSLFHCKDYYGECNLYFNPDLGSLNKEFINAWANGSIASNSTTNTDTGSCAYALSLAMAAGNTLDSEMGVEGGNGDEEEHTMCSNLTLRSPVSWVPFASGGPLAEVLKPSQQHHHHHHPSISNGDSISPAGTTVSSPSGVLQKTNLFSQSDGSVCNSPTVAASELVPFQWLS